MTEKEIFTVTEEHKGLRLDAYVSLAAGITRSNATKRIEGGEVLVSGRAEAKRYAVKCREIYKTEIYKINDVAERRSVYHISDTARNYHCDRNTVKLGLFPVKEEVKHQGDDGDGGERYKDPPMLLKHTECRAAVFNVGQV